MQYSTSSVPKTILLKSPDSDKVREVIITSLLFPKSENDNLKRTSFTFSSRETIMSDKRFCKRRLDHLTLEEKLLRKKLKNREAAQTSRDKKKARMEELEARLLKLEHENELLHKEVETLSIDRERLSQENTRLSGEVGRLSVASGTSGSAVSYPLPKGVCPPITPLHHLLSVLLLTLMTGTGSTQMPLPLWLRNLNYSQVLSLLRLRVLKFQKRRKKIWWGRRQKAWNPIGHMRQKKK